MPSYKAPVDLLVSPGSRDKLGTPDVESLTQDPIRAIKESYRASFFESESVQEGERLAEVLAVDMDVKLPSDLNYFGESVVANQYGTRSWISAICRIIDQHGTTPDPDQTFEAPSGTIITIPFKETTRLRSNIGKFYAPLDDIQGKGATNIQVGDWLIVEYQDKLLRNNGIIKDVYLKKDLSTWRQVGTVIEEGGGGGGDSGLAISGEPFVGCGPGGTSLEGVDLINAVGQQNAKIFDEDPFCFSNNSSFGSCNFKPPCKIDRGLLNAWKNPKLRTWMEGIIQIVPDVPPAVLVAIGQHEGAAPLILGTSSSHHKSGMIADKKFINLQRVKPKTRAHWNEIPAAGWSASDKVWDDKKQEWYCNYGFGPFQLDATAHDLWHYYETEARTWDPAAPAWTKIPLEQAWLPNYKRALGRGLPVPAAIACACAGYNGGDTDKPGAYLRGKDNGDMARAWAGIDRNTCGGSYGTGSFVIARLVACAIISDPANFGYLKR